MALKLRVITKIILISFVIILSMYDIWALIFGGVDATISRIVLSYAKDYPIIPFAFGVVCGHLFWSQKEK